MTPTKAAKPKPRCLVRGSINVDEFFLVPHIVKPGETISSTEYIVKPGGKGANQAYAIARAGGSVDLHGAVGRDGLWVKQLLQNAGAGVDQLRVLEGEVTGRAIIQRADDGENSIVLHKGANFNIPSSDTSPNLAGYTHLLLQNEIPLASTVAHLQAASQYNITSVFNPSPMLTPAQLRDFPWKALTWLIVNEGELETLLKAFDATPTDLTLGVQENASKEIIALHNCKAFHQGVSIICTLGPLGVLYFQPGRGVHHMAAAMLRNPLKDTTGAGDCFAGYFVAGLMTAEDEEEHAALLYAINNSIIAAAICVENAGAMESIPARSDVIDRY